MRTALLLASLWALVAAPSFWPAPASAEARGQGNAPREAPQPRATSAGTEIAGIEFHDIIDLTGRELRLQICGTRDVLWASVFAAALYVPAATGLPAVGTPDQAKAVRLIVLNDRLLPGRIPEKYRRALEQVVPEHALHDLQRGFSRLKRGDTLWITYAPAQGTVASFGGHGMVALPGHAAIDAVLAAWSGERDWFKKLQETAGRHPC